MLNRSDLENTTRDFFVGMSAKDVSRYSLARVCRSLIDSNGSDEIKDGIEIEYHQELRRRKLGGAGFAVPWDVLANPAHTRDMTAGTFGQGGAFVPTVLQTDPIPLLRNVAATARLGVEPIFGLTGNPAFPRQTGASSPQSLPETALANGSTPAIDQITMTPRRITTTINFSRQLAIQSSIGIENWLRKEIVTQTGITIDEYVLYGTGSNSQPLGIVNTPGVGSVIFGGAPTWASILAFENSLAVANADQNMSAGWIVSPSTKMVLKNTARLLQGATTVAAIPLWEKGSFNDGTADGIINEARAASTNQVMNNQVIYGNWKSVILGFFGQGLDIISNPYTGAASGIIELTGTTYMDIAVRHAASFCVSADAGNQ